jgi:hypothetical protein
VGDAIRDRREWTAAWSIVSFVAIYLVGFGRRIIVVVGCCCKFGGVSNASLMDSLLGKQEGCRMVERYCRVGHGLVGVLFYCLLWLMGSLICNGLSPALLQGSQMWRATGSLSRE